MEHQAWGFKIPLLCLLSLATVSLDIEPDLISMQKKYTREWNNCLLWDITASAGDITVSGLIKRFSRKTVLFITFVT